MLLIEPIKNLTGKLFCTFWWYILRNVECVKMFENESGIFNDKIELRNYKKAMALPTEIIELFKDSNSTK